MRKSFASSICVAIVICLLASSAVLAGGNGTGVISVPDQNLSQGKPIVIKLQTGNAAHSFRSQLTFKDKINGGYVYPRFQIMAKGWRLHAIGVSSDGRLDVNADKGKGAKPLTPGEHIILYAFLGDFTGILEVAVDNVLINHKVASGKSGFIVVLPPPPFIIFHIVGFGVPVPIGW